MNDAPKLFGAHFWDDSDPLRRVCVSYTGGVVFADGEQVGSRSCRAGAASGPRDGPGRCAGLGGLQPQDGRALAPRRHAAWSMVKRRLAAGAAVKKGRAA